MADQETWQDRLLELAERHHIKVVTVEELKAEREEIAKRLSAKYGVPVDQIAEAVKDRRLDCINEDVTDWLMTDSMIQEVESDPEVGK